MGATVEFQSIVLSLSDRRDSFCLDLGQSVNPAPKTASSLWRQLAQDQCEVNFWPCVLRERMLWPAPPLRGPVCLDHRLASWRVRRLSEYDSQPMDRAVVN